MGRSRVDKPRKSRATKRATSIRSTQSIEHNQQDRSLKLKDFRPITENQKFAYEEFGEGQHLVMLGYPGCGKTLVSMALGLKEVFKEDSSINKVVIVRSAVPTRNQGFLPGNLQEKMEVYEAPYRGLSTELFGRGDAYSILKQKGIIQFTTTSYCRGITIEDAVVIVEEFASMTKHELDTVISRLGKNSRIIFSGDLDQSDLTERERTGVVEFLDILENIDDFSFIEFGVHDIVRSGLVKKYIIEKYRRIDKNG